MSAFNVHELSFNRQTRPTPQNRAARLWPGVAPCLHGRGQWQQPV